MKNKKKYGKPAVFSVRLKANRKVAEQCWSPQAEVREHFGWYNIPGFGGIQFRIGTEHVNNCGNGHATFNIVKCIDNNGNEILWEEFERMHPGITEAQIEKDVNSYRSSQSWSFPLAQMILII